MADVEDRIPASAAMEFDYIVVGAGSAGSVSASYLARDGAKTKVALLDAGVYVPSLAGTIDQPAGDIWSHFRCFWDPPGPACNTFQARVLGGGSSVNSQVYTRLPADDIPHWTPETIRAAYAAIESRQPRVLISPLLQELSSAMYALLQAFQLVVPQLRWRLDPHAPSTPSTRISGWWRSQSPWDVNRKSVTRVSTSQAAWSAQRIGRSTRTTPYARLIGNPTYCPGNVGEGHCPHNLYVFRI